MMWVFQAVIAPATVIPAHGPLTQAVTVEVGCGLRLIPMTREVHREVTGLDWPRGRCGCQGEDEPIEVQPQSPYGSIFPAGLERVLARWSVTGPVAYVEVEHIAKLEGETATVWRHGEVALGPLSWDNMPDGLGGRTVVAAVTPLVAALRELGVPASRRSDQIAAAGLRHVPFTEMWVDLSGR